MSNNISPLISGQLPEHLREDSPLFVNFLETYYRYASQRGKAVGVLQYRAEDSDLDTTTDAYLEKFYEQNAKYFPKDVAFDRRNLLKLLNQIYEAKGTEKALVLVFRLLFNDAVTVTYPSEQILRASGGIWSQENYVTAVTQYGLPPKVLPYALNVSNDFGDYFLAINKVLKVDEVTTRFYYRSYEKVVFFDNQVVTIKDFAGDAVYSGVLIKTTSKLTIKNPGKGWQQGQVIIFPGSTVPTIARVTKVDSIGSITNIEVVDYGYTHEDGQTLIISPHPNRPEDSTVDITTELVGVGQYHYRISISDETDGCVESVVGIGTLLDADSYFLNDYAEVGYMGKKVIGVLTQQAMPFAVIKTGLTIQEWLASRAILVFNSDYVVKTKGSFYDDASKISNQEVKLQDNYYYQPFSYVINTPKDIREYEGILTLTHPAGTKRFSDVTKKLGYSFNFTGSRAISVGNLSAVDIIVISDTNLFDLSKPLFSATNATLDAITYKLLGKSLADFIASPTDSITNKDTGKAVADPVDPPTDSVESKTTGKAVADPVDPPTDAITNKDTGKAVADPIDPPTDSVESKTTGKAVVDLTDPATDVIANKATGKAVVDLINPPTDSVESKNTGKTVDDLIDPATDVIANKATGKAVADPIDPIDAITKKDTGKVVVDPIDPPTDSVESKTTGKAVDDPVDPIDAITSKDTGKALTYFVSESQIVNIYQSGASGLLLPELSEVSSLFQNSSGTTPITSIEQPLGLTFDKRLGPVSELITTGTFDSAAGWTLTGSGWSISTGKLRYSAGTAFAQAIFNFPTVVGKSYEAFFDTDAVSGGTFHCQVYDAEFVPLPNVGYTFIGTVASKRGFSFVAITTTSNVLLQANDATLNAVIDNISIRLFGGNHLSQATAASRPLLSARVNLLTKSELFTDTAVWGLTGTGAATGPTTVSMPAGDTGIYQNIAVTVGLMYTVSAKLSGSGTMRFVLGGFGGDGPQITLTATPTLHTFTGQATAPVATLYIHRRPTDSATSVQVDGIQHEPGTVPTRYQRVNTATDYDTAGFLHYIKHDGIDDGLVTNPFLAGSLTNNMDCFVAIRRDSAARSILFGSEVGKLFGYFELGGSGLSAQGCGGNVSFFVNGVAVPGGLVTNGMQLNAALPVGIWCVLEMRNLDLSAFTAIQLSSFAAHFFNGAISDIVLCPTQSDSMRVNIRNHLFYNIGLPPTTGGAFDAVLGDDICKVNTSKVLVDSVNEPDQLTTALNKLMEDFVVAEHNNASSPVISTYDSELFFLQDYVERSISLTI